MSPADDLDDSEDSEDDGDLDDDLDDNEPSSEHDYKDDGILTEDERSSIIESSLDEDDAVAVGPDGKPERKPPETWFLTPLLLSAFELWPSHQANLMDPENPWCRHWRAHPAEALTLEAAYVDAVQQWFEVVDALDLEHFAKSTGDSIRKQISDLDQRLRTLCILAYPVTCAVSTGNYELGLEGDGFQHRRELMQHETYRLFQHVRTYIYQQTPYAKARKKAYDAKRHQDPDVADKAAARLRAWAAAKSKDPEFKAAEAARMRELRARRKAAVAEKAAQELLIETTLKDV